MTLPPGQHAVQGFPRFGTHGQHPPPEGPADPVIEIGGAPVRLVSPSQYGFVSTKHLCRIEVHTSDPAGSALAAGGPTVDEPASR